MVKSNSFLNTYRSLNTNQKKAVDLIDGPVMVIAGPGTGKTQVLAARIANILKKTDTNPSSILALTFTESAARNMQQRLVEMVGRTGYYVQVQTFHAFCNDVIRAYPEFFSIQRESEPLTDIERHTFFQEIIDQTKLEIIKPLNAPYFYLSDVIRSISQLKREGISAKDYQKIIVSQQTQDISNMKKIALERHKRNLAKNQDLLKIYKKYQKSLKENRRHDFDDMIALVVEAFETQDFLLREYQENLHYFLVDEYQDTNSAQNKVVDLLASFWGEQANLFVVGDPNQAIYRFQGASVENMLNFASRYPAAEIITLNQGYRCPQSIYTRSAAVISQNKLNLQVDNSAISKKMDQISLMLSQALESKNAKDNPIQVVSSPSQTVEHMFVAEKILQLIKKGVKPEEIAVLYRRNSDQQPVAEVLDKWSIRYEVEGGGNILDDEYISQLFTFLSTIHNLSLGVEDEGLYQVMQYPWLGLDSLAVMKMIRLVSQKRMGVIDFLQSGHAGAGDLKNKNNQSVDLTEMDLEVMRQFMNKMNLWNIANAQLPFHEWFEKVIDESGYLSWVMNQSTKFESLTNLNSLFNHIKSMVSKNKRMKLADFLNAIELIREHHIRISPEDLNVRSGAVHLSTVHKAKGREWEYVFLLQVVDKKWGNNTSRNLIPLPPEILVSTNLDEKDKNEDERRLFYVALTRAKKQVFVSCPLTLINNSLSKDVIKSIFVEELLDEADPKNLESIDSSFLIPNPEEKLVKLLGKPQTRKPAISETEFFTKILSKFKMSVTALNTYLRDPQEFVENNLLRIPRAKPVPMVFGSAVHAAFEQLNHHFQTTQKWLSKKQFIEQFVQAIEKETLSVSELTKRIEYGKEILNSYYEFYQSESPQILFTEKFFGSGKSKVYLDDIPLTGRIDRIDLIDKEKKTVLVVDYKTGRAKSANMIDGKTASSNLSLRELDLPPGIRGPYKRQLLFYKLLTKLDRHFFYKVESGVFDFVEPDKQTGKLVRRQFSLIDQDVDDLAELIKTVMAEIRSLKFLEMI